MVKKVFLYFNLFICFATTLQAQYIRNGAMNGEHGNDNPPDYWGACDQSTPELYDSFTRNDTTYYSIDSSTFCILRVRDFREGDPQSLTTENLFTELLQPLEKNYCYMFHAFLRHTFNGTAAPEPTYPVKLQIWGGMDSCLVETDYDNFELLYSSELIDNEEWEDYAFAFSVKKTDYPYLFIRPYWDIPDYLPEEYRGIIFLDSLRLEQLMYIGPPFEDTALYYYSRSRLLRLNAVDGTSYLWDPPQVVSQYDDQSIYLIDFVDSLYATVANSEECPASYKYHIIYDCDTVYKGFPLRKDTIQLSSTDPVFLDASLGVSHHWYLFEDSLSYHDPVLVFDTYTDWLSDTLTYTDSIEDTHGCRFPEQFNIIRICDSIHRINPIDRGDYFYNFQPIQLNATAGASYVWTPENRLNSYSTQTVQFMGYHGDVEDMLTYNVNVTDIFDCEFSERFNIIRDCDLLNPDHASFVMMDTVVDKILSFSLSPEGIPVTPWSPPEGLSCTDCVSPIATPTSSQIYEVYLTDSLGCDRHEVYKIKIDLMIPNVITPNGDGKNDQFIIPGLPKGSSINIFAKDGKLIYSNSNYGYDEWWDGKDLNNETVALGTYWFVLEIPSMALVKKDFVFVKR